MHFRADPADPASLSEGRVRAILEDDAGALWVGTSAGGPEPPRSRDGPLRALPPRPEGRRQPRARPGARAPAGRRRTAVGGHERGARPAATASRRTFAHYRQDPTNPASLADDHVLSLAQDRGGVLWVGTRLGGVHKWNPLSWQFGHVAPDPGNPAGLGSGHVTSFSEDRAGRLWIGTFDAGLYVMDRTTGEMTAYRHDPRKPGSLGSDRVMALRHDHRGDLWIGTLDAGLDRFRAATGVFTHYRQRPEAAGRPRRQGRHLDTGGPRGPAVARHLRGRAGDDRSRDGAVHALPLRPEGPREPERRQGLEPGRGGGRPPVGGHDGEGHQPVRPADGPVRPPRATGRETPAACPSDVVHTLFVDAAGGLWVGTHGGLSHLPPEGESFETFTTRRRPAERRRLRRPQRPPGAALAEHQQRARRASTPAHRQFTSYGVSDGLQSAEFNFGAWHQSPSGELFFGGVNGFNAFVPDRLRRVAAPPPVVLTSLSVDHRPLAGPPDETRQVSLGFRDKVLGLEFAALDFTAPQRNRFAYKLEGFDPEWVPLRGRRSVTYTNLNPGRYTFRLRAASGDGRWNEEGLAAGRRRGGGALGHSLGLRRLRAAPRRRRRRGRPRPAAEARPRGRARAAARAAGPGEDPGAVGAAAGAGARQRGAGPGQHHRLAHRAREPALPDRVPREGGGAPPPPLPPARPRSRVGGGRRPGLRHDRPGPLQGDQRLGRPRGRRRRAPADAGAAGVGEPQLGHHRAVGRRRVPARGPGAERGRPRGAGGADPQQRGPAHLRRRGGAGGADDLLASASPATRSSRSSSTR